MFASRLIFILFVEKIVFALLSCPNQVQPDEASCTLKSDTCSNGSLECTSTRFESTNNSKSFCCLSTNKTIYGWFTELGIYPTAIPQMPPETIKKITLMDPMTNLRIDINGIGVDVSTVNSSLQYNATISPTMLSNSTVLPSPTSTTTQATSTKNASTGILGYTNTFYQLETVTFETTPPADGFLHFLIAVDPMLIPSAIFFYYDYPSFGIRTINLTQINDRYERGFVKLIDPTPIQKQDSYASQYVILVFKTGNILDAYSIDPSQSVVNQALQEAQADLRKLLTDSFLGITLGSPIAGTVFNLTTSTTMFSITQTSEPINLATTYNSHKLTLLFIFICIFH
uniref:Uncharacterized protein n=1 Tax=Acrobeloides nanus TaxID=290746 RepID=A0A914C203_9BILA